jgi:formylglycine-generating enzyme required for sulfatase activity
MVAGAVALVLVLAAVLAGRLLQSPASPEKTAAARPTENAPGNPLPAKVDAPPTRDTAKPAPQPTLPEPPPRATLREDLVLIPAGRLKKGCWDESTTVKLVREYNNVDGEALGALLDPAPRTVPIKPFYMDRYEVTNAEYTKFLQEAGASARFDHPDQPKNTNHVPGLQSDAQFNQPDQPVVGVDWFDAYAYAAWAGKRLPTEDEWETAARGGDQRLYPWGMECKEERYQAEHVAGKGPAPVKGLEPEYPGGPAGLAGNVAEWTASQGPAEGTKVARGGAWTVTPGAYYALVFRQHPIPAATRATDVGFRCAKDAVGALPPEMVRISGGRVRLGGEDTPLLAVLRKCKGINNPGEVFVRRYPAEEVMVAAFRMDRCEVSNAEYRAFLRAVQRSGDDALRHPDQPAGKDHTPNDWGELSPASDDLPVVGVDWFDAYAFARWAGKRLPTNNEWEFAARGATTQIYPWGDTFDPSRCAPVGKGPVSVHSNPEGQSPYGVLHLADNVQEWSADDMDENHNKVLRGGSWSMAPEIHGLVYLKGTGSAPTKRHKDVGFRCAKDE